MTCVVQPITSSIVNIATGDNVTLQDAFRFGVLGDTTWSFTGQSFRMEVKASRDDAVALAAWTSGAGQIVVDDAVQRVLHLNVSEAAIQAALPVADYVYDLVMISSDPTPVRVQLMQGTLSIGKGVTEN